MEQTGIISTAVISLIILVILIIGVRSMIRRATTGCCGAGDEINLSIQKIGTCPIIPTAIG